MDHYQTVVIGAGLAGLSCATRLHAHGHDVLLLEAADAVGGRVRTDRLDTPQGTFRLDRGFQVYLDAYPDARALLDHDALQLRAFTPGALIRRHNAWIRVCDPLRRPLDALNPLLRGIATPLDVPRLAGLYARLVLSEAAPHRTPDIPAVDFLRNAGLSQRVIDRFLRPFFAGVFFDRELATSARMFAFCFRMFAEGSTTLPASGMQAIPDQLADRLPQPAIRLNTRAVSIDLDAAGAIVRTIRAGDIRAERVVIATEADTAEQLLRQRDRTTHRWAHTATIYFAADQPPTPQPILLLDPDDAGPINHAAVVSNVQPGYAPPGLHLIAANTAANPPGPDSALIAHARAQLGRWFPDHAPSWRPLRVLRVPRALPDQRPGRLDPWQRPLIRRGPVLVCGDHLDNASINGAIVSGLRAADLLLNET